MSAVATAGHAVDRKPAITDALTRGPFGVRRSAGTGSAATIGNVDLLKASLIRPRLRAGDVLPM
jgi:hypothetical protein